jgi:hypothetical protein
MSTSRQTPREGAVYGPGQTQVGPAGPDPALVRSRHRRAVHARAPPQQLLPTHQPTSATKLDGRPNREHDRSFLLSDSAADLHHRSPSPAATRQAPPLPRKSPQAPPPLGKSRSAGSEPLIPAWVTRLETQGAARRRPAAAVGRAGFAQRLPPAATRVREWIGGARVGFEWSPPCRPWRERREGRVVGAFLHLVIA